MGDRGRLVIPAELRERMKLHPGSPLLLFETPQGVVMVTRDQAKRLVRERLQGPSLVEELLAARRELAVTEEQI